MTSTLQTNAAADPQYRPPSLWVTVPVILLCLAGGGFVIRLYVKTNPLAHESVQLGDATPAVAAPNIRVPQGVRNFFGGGGGGNNGNGGNRPPANRGGGASGTPSIRPNGERWEAQTAKARMYFGTNRSGHVGLEQAYYKSVEFIPREAKNTSEFMRAINANAEQAKVVKDMSLTPDQLAKLRRISRAPSMVVSAADRASLDAAYAAYQDASAKERSASTDKATLATATAAAQAKLFATMDDVADRSMGPTSQAFVAEATAINAVVTPDQWKIYAATGNGH